ncbi:MAG: enoyl-[acyl-carrier-protein] reductase FabL [Anaerolineae bacterium]|nr:enoyl-[acyl-carrier-protein] reductase FabL [Anaerolineae bacterium]
MTGRIALVTGSSRGIGRTIALRLASEGADVIVNYLRKRTAAGEVAAEIEAKGRRVRPVKADIGDPEDVKRLFEEARDFGGLDILIANAATGVMRPLLDISEKHWYWTFRTNVWGFLSLVQQAVPLMVERGGGHIIVLTSVGSGRVLEHYGLVGASKAALEALVRYLAVELAPKGIVVSAVSPSFVRTDAVRFLPNSDQLLEQAQRQTPAGRLVTADDVASVVSFLCSGQAQMITGQIIVIDGGYTLPIGRLDGSSFTSSRGSL